MSDITQSEAASIAIPSSLFYVLQSIFPEFPTAKRTVTSYDAAGGTGRQFQRD